MRTSTNLLLVLELWIVDFGWWLPLHNCQMETWPPLEIAFDRLDTNISCFVVSRWTACFCRQFD